MDDKSEKYIFIGYDSNSKGYKLCNPNTRKTISNQDIIFNEEGEWDWGPHNENYNFFTYWEQDSMEESRVDQAREESTTPPASPTTRFEGDESLSERVPRFKSLQELYEVIENQDNLTLFCLFFTNCEPMSFQEARENKN